MKIQPTELKMKYIGRFDIHFLNCNNYEFLTNEITSPITMLLFLSLFDENHQKYFLKNEIK